MRNAFTILVSVFLAICLLSVGLFVCCIPQVTTVLCMANCGQSNTSTFTTEQLTYAGEATRNYTIDTHDIQEVSKAIQKINYDQNTPYAHASQDEIMACTDDRYTLTPDAISHLDDVYHVVSNARIFLCFVAPATVAGLIFTGKKWGTQALRRIFIGGPIALLAFLAVTCLCAVIDFNAFFAFFHSLFFTGDSWLFSYRSLLISMYPEMFWVEMALIWFASSTIACFIFILIAHTIKKRSFKHVN